MVSFKFSLLLLVQQLLANAETCYNEDELSYEVDLFETAMKQEGPEAALALLQVKKEKTEKTDADGQWRRGWHNGYRHYGWGHGYRGGWGGWGGLGGGNGGWGRGSGSTWIRRCGGRGCWYERVPQRYR
ncbi:unnamed protein product [Durusdinium trenchii]|uniref:Uncharacterized protein n=1 Tax=Durusdinium trenchii TaxID=1381693 RepID=A0ABP0QTS3_9DINO